MAFKDLRDFMALLESKGQLKRITAEVDPYLEIGEITDRVSKQVGPALLFENPINRATGERYATPVVINLMGSYDRMAWALGVDAETGTWLDLDAVAKRLMELIPLELAVHKMTGATARALKLKDRGLLKEGYRADVTIFDPVDFKDRATYAQPHQFPTGSRTSVIVNGTIVVDGAKHTQALPGRVLRRDRAGAVA